jgi:hypothetical protein
MNLQISTLCLDQHVGCELELLFSQVNSFTQNLPYILLFCALAASQAMSGGGLSHTYSSSWWRDDTEEENGANFQMRLLNLLSKGRLS